MDEKPLSGLPEIGKIRKQVSTLERQRLIHISRGGAVVACRAHNPKVVSSNLTPASKAPIGIAYREDIVR